MARERIAEVIDLADHDILDIARSRAAEQEVFNPVRSGWRTWDWLPTVRLERKIGKISAGIMGRLKDVLAFALDLERASE
jgi:hypothetical protein